MAALLLIGCQQEEIRKYKAPKDEEPRSQAKAEGARPSIRMVVAIFPQADRTWFFKFVGVGQAVDEHKEEFERFIQTVRFTPQADPPVTWTAPESWQHQPGGSEFRYATFHVGTKDVPAELTVTPLDGKAGSVLANVNRWRGQISLGEITQAELSQLSRETKVNGVLVTWVDMVNPGTGGGAARAALPLKYTVPEGWKELPNAKSPAVAALRVSQGDQTADTTITPLSGGAGGLIPNILRWRGQLGLKPATEEEIRKETRNIKVDGAAAQYVDLTGPETAGGRQILGVIYPHGEQTWFIKMTGPAELVGKQKPAFEAFIQSVRFNGGTGANHE